jgi:hypothetical protein
MKYYLLLFFKFTRETLNQIDFIPPGYPNNSNNFHSALMFHCLSGLVTLIFFTLQLYLCIQD